MSPSRRVGGHETWDKGEAIVNLCEWLTGYIEGLRDDGDRDLADSLTEDLLRPALCALHPVHSTVTL